MDNFYAQLKSRAILAISGNNITEFLQGVCTSDINKLDKNTLGYGAHLNPQGRFLYDFFILKQNDKILLECNKHELMDLAKSLHKYTLNFSVEFDDMSDDYNIFAIFGNESNEGYPDPRHKKLGNRIYLPKNKKPTTGKEKLEDAYEEYRINLCIPDGSKDAIKNRTFSAELGLEFLNGVSFDKGCYVGQELVARLHFRTEAKKRLYKISSKNKISTSMPIMFENSEVSKISSAYNNTGLAIINTRYANKKLSCNNEEINISAPDWWQQKS